MEPMPDAAWGDQEPETRKVVDPRENQIQTILRADLMSCMETQSELNGSLEVFYLIIKNNERNGLIGQVFFQLSCFF